MNVKKIDFPGNQYFQTQTKKKTFIIHHSAGWDDARKMYNIWATDSQGRVSTAYGITDDGTIYQGFDTAFWAHALYINAPRNLINPQFKTTAKNTALNSQAIQVEICNWGALFEKQGKLYAWPAYTSNNWVSRYEVPKSRAIHYEDGFKGSRWYEKYTDAEIESLRRLILFHHEKDGIILEYNADMWSPSEKALKGSPGIWTHVSYRTDKSDCHPQPELIEMLKGLKP